MIISSWRSSFSIFVARRVMVRVVVLRFSYGSYGQQGMMLFGTLFRTRHWELGGWIWAIGINGNLPKQWAVRVGMLIPPCPRKFDGKSVLMGGWSAVLTLRSIAPYEFRRQVVALGIHMGFCCWSFIKDICSYISPWRGIYGVVGSNSSRYCKRLG